MALESDSPYFKAQFHPSLPLGVLRQVIKPFYPQFLYLQSGDSDILPMKNEGEDFVKHLV